MPRLFAAVWPPEEVLEGVAALDRPAVDGLRWTRPDQWHVTLRFLGPTDLEPVRAALGAVEVPPATAWLGPAVGRFGQRILHVPVAGLDAVASAVVDATAGLGRPPDDRPFAGHLTLARVAKGARVDLRPLAGAAVEGKLGRHGGVPGREPPVAGRRPLRGRRAVRSFFVVLTTVAVVRRTKNA